MATALDVIKRALRLIRAIDAGETPTATESSNALAVFNAMIGSWGAQPQTAYAMTDVTATLTGSQQEYTVGTGGDITTRIVRIESAYILDGNTSLPLNVYTDDEWNGIPDKTNTGTPLVYNYQRGGTLGSLRLWPIPSKSYSMIMTSIVALDSLELTDTIVWPAEYEDAAALSLARRLSPEYGPNNWTALLEDQYKEAVNVMKRLNAAQQVSQTQFCMPGVRSDQSFFRYFKASP